MLREALREDKGGTYFVRASANSQKQPESGYKITLGFGCSPDNVADLTKTMFEKIEELKKTGPSEKNLQKVKETERRSFETDQKENRWWLNGLTRSLMNGDNPQEILTVQEVIDQVTAKDLKKIAKKFLNTKNYVKVVLVPEEKM